MSEWRESWIWKHAHPTISMDSVTTFNRSQVGFNENDVSGQFDRVGKFPAFGYIFLNKFDRKCALKIKNPGQFDLVEKSPASGYIFLNKFDRRSAFKIKNPKALKIFKLNSCRVDFPNFLLDFIIILLEILLQTIWSLFRLLCVVDNLKSL